jgi:predicted nucleotidyltransferase
LDSVKITYFDSGAVRRALEEYVVLITIRHPEIEEVVLFGSLATGSAVPGSDVDLLLVLNGSDRPFRDRIPVFLPSGFPVGMDVFPYTRDEIERMKREGNTFILQALRTARTLFKK